MIGSVADARRQRSWLAGNELAGRTGRPGRESVHRRTHQVSESDTDADPSSRRCSRIWATRKDRRMTFRHRPIAAATPGTHGRGIVEFLEAFKRHGDGAVGPLHNQASRAAGESGNRDLPPRLQLSPSSDDSATSRRLRRMPSVSGLNGGRSGSLRPDHVVNQQSPGSASTRSPDDRDRHTVSYRR